MTEFSHVTVLLNEAVNEMNVSEHGNYIDATLGGGGHTSNILKHLDTGHLYSFDQDETAIKYNSEKLSDYIQNHQLTLIHSNFRNLSLEMNRQGISKVDGILYDLGVSSPQFDDAERGFSYRYDTRLDMRMDQEQDLDAWKVVNEWSYNQLVRIFFRYGEEKFSKQIARKIEEQREQHPINTTGQLVEIIKDAIPAAARRHGGHPAKKVFQAIRVAVNDELSALEDSLESAFELLDVGGRICVITFQSLEDKLVKTMFKEKSSLPDDLPSNLPIIPEGIKPKFKLITRKPILPSNDEQEVNHRSHSAKLRVIERIKD